MTEPAVVHMRVGHNTFCRCAHAIAFGLPPGVQEAIFETKCTYREGDLLEAISTVAMLKGEAGVANITFAEGPCPYSCNDA